jgi:hypothetical protein
MSFSMPWNILASSQSSLLNSAQKNIVSPIISKVGNEVITPDLHMLEDGASTVVNKVSEMGSDLANTVFGKAGDMFSSATNGAASDLVNSALGEPVKKLSESISGLTKGLGAGDITGITGKHGATDSQNKVFQLGVRLTSKTDGNFVFFNIMPTVTESRSATYDEVSFPQHPGAILKYAGTSVRTWSIGSIMLVSRNADEATLNQMTINTLRGWLMPYYGYGTESEADQGGLEKLGAPPDILTLSAYGDKNIGPVPVVLENFSVNWPNDVDYITTVDGQPFPVLLHIDGLQLKEAWSAREHSNFNIFEYKSGVMAGAYSSKPIAASQAEEKSVAKKSPDVVKDSAKPKADIISTVAKKISSEVNSAIDTGSAFISDQLTEITGAGKSLFADIGASAEKITKPDGTTAIKDVVYKENEIYKRNRVDATFMGFRK